MTAKSSGWDKFDGGLMFDVLEAKAELTIKCEEGDYILDGLLHCGKCKTPKQARVEVFGRVRTPMCLCKCEAERVKKEQEQYERAQLELEFKQKKSVMPREELLWWLNCQPYKISPKLTAARHDLMRDMCFAEDNMKTWTFSNDDGGNEKTMTVMRNYVANIDKFREQGKGLLLFGGVGSGKTFAAACVANALIDMGVPCMMTNFARIANTVQGMFDGRQEYYDSFNKYPLLVLDDLSAERKTEYMQEIVFNVIDSRYRAKLPLIVTSNLTADEIKNPADIAYQRIFSRLLEMCVPIEVKGEDRRRKILKDSFGEYSGLLGI